MFTTIRNMWKVIFDNKCAAVIMFGEIEAVC